MSGLTAAPVLVGEVSPTSPLALEHGGSISRCRIGFQLYGDADLPLVVVLGGISASRHLASHPADPRRGWWEDFVGDGLAVDTRRFRVLGVDYLALPRVDTRDQARAVAAVLDHLSVEAAHAVVGASYGGMVALALASLLPHRLRRAVVISAAHESHPMATALRTLQRRVVGLGLETGRPAEALSIARGIAMTTYRTAAEFAERFDGAAEVEDYLEEHGRRFARAFSPWSFLRLSESIDLHRVDPRTVRTPTTLVAVDSDTLVPPWQMRALHARLGGEAELVEIGSVYGHDAFLKETETISACVTRALNDGGA